MHIAHVIQQATKKKNIHSFLVAAAAAAAVVVDAMAVVSNLQLFRTHFAKNIFWHRKFPTVDMTVHAEKKKTMKL